MPQYIKQAPSKQERDMSAVEETPRRMLADIKYNGDDAVTRYAVELDKWHGGEFRVTNDQIAQAEASLPETFKEDFDFCHRQVVNFAKRQLETLTDFECETEPGIFLGQRQIPVSNVGCYIPGGKYPLVAAASMSVGVARAAGVEHIIGCAPPRDGEEMYAPTLYALQKAGAQLTLHDPEAREEAEKHLNNVTWTENPYDVAVDADALIIMTEWNEYRALSVKKLGDMMKVKRLIDMRNIYKPEFMRENGFHYVSIGRPAVNAEDKNKIRAVS
mgnify:CR=1 FL=1